MTATTQTLLFVGSQGRKSRPLVFSSSSPGWMTRSTKRISRQQQAHSTRFHSLHLHGPPQQNQPGFHPSSCSRLRSTTTTTTTTTIAIRRAHVRLPTCFPFLHPAAITTTTATISPERSFPSARPFSTVSFLESSLDAVTSSSSSLSTTTTTSSLLTFETTPLGRNGAHLLKGLDVYQVPSKSDGHLLAVYGIQSQNIPKSNKNSDGSNNKNRRRRPPILLLHGRTWSSVPVYHLMGGGCDGWNQNTSEDATLSSPSTQSTQSPSTQSSSRSLMEALYEHGLQPYAMDFRGFGGTHPDATGYVEPLLCVTDMESVMQWIAQRHAAAADDEDDEDDHHEAASTAGGSRSSEPSSSPLPRTGQVNLLGWSQGALVAQLGAQKLAWAAGLTASSTGNTTASTFLTTRPRGLLNKLILYGSIYDPLVRYPREPLYRLNNQPNQEHIRNTFDMAIEDFTLEGSIPPEPAKLFAQAALTSDPIKAVWKHVYQFNNCDPARIQHPTLVIGGDQDPYAPLRVQQELFGQLGRGAGNDRVWAILADCDHAVHLLNDGRQRFIQHVVNFVQSD